jgi:effector-binding domain-containing protein
MNNMTSEPSIVTRDEQPYVGVPLTVTMSSLPQAIDSTFPRIFGWLGEHGITPAGPPFIRFFVIDMEADLEVELGVPVQAGIEGDEQIRASVLPGGQYVSLLHTGPYDQLIAANSALQDWAEQHGASFDSWDTDHGSGWRSRFESYITDPSTESDPSKWETEIAYLIKQ